MSEKKVKIVKDGDWYVARTLAGGDVKYRGASKSKDRSVLRRIYEAAGFTVVR